MSLSVRSATRRYVGLTGLHWLPVGLSAPVTVLLASARGLSPADIGLAFAVYSMVVLVLELPTGGLADAVGHRPVLVLAGLLTTAGLLLLVVAGGMAGFALALALLGVGRALDSGPLEAWYVDTARATDPDADVTPGLSRAGAADGAGLCLGALLGGLLPLLAGDGGTGVLAVLLVGVGRTLDSGPLEAWYVDTVHALAPGADVTPGLAKHSAADGAGLAVGAVVGGLLPGLLAGGGSAALALPFLVAAALEHVHVGAAREPARRPRRGPGDRPAGRP